MPVLLISSVARSIAFLALCPYFAAPPVNGNIAPILISFVSGCFFEQAGRKKLVAEAAGSR